MKNYILIITLHADPAMPSGYEEWGGTHAYMRELLEMCTKQKIYALLITRQSMNGLPLYEKYSSYCYIYRIVNDGKPQADKHTLIKYHQENLKKIQNIILSQKNLPICIHSVYWNSGRIAMELSSLYHIPFVHSVISNSLGRNMRGAIPDIPERSFYEKQIYKSARYVLCVSEDEKSDLISLYEVPEERILVAGQAISDPFFYPIHDKNGFPVIGFSFDQDEQDLFGRENNKIFNCPTDGTDDFWIYKAFTYFGRMSLDKGVDIIIRSWYCLYEKYKEECPPLWLVGGSIKEIEEIRTVVKKIIPKLNVIEANRKIVWWGYLNSDGISTILLKSIAVLAHSRYEPGGRVILEAMAESIPVIATANGFAKDIIHDWHNGFTVSYGDVAGLSQKMEYFIHQPLLGDILGSNAHCDVKKYYNHLHFEEYHLYAYGVLSSVSITDVTVKETTDNYMSFALNIYPYISTVLSDQYVRSLIEEKTMSHVKKDDLYCMQSSSIINRYISDNSTYYTKQFVTRMATNAIYNPVMQHVKVRYARERFLREKFIYEKLRLPYFIYADDENLLLILNEISHISLHDTVYLSLCISHLKKDYDYLSDMEKHTAMELFNRDTETLIDIESNIDLLTETFPEFYFECTGLFSPNLCWKVICKILNFNMDRISADKQKIYNSLVDVFSNVVFPIDEKDFRYVNLDAAPRHLLFNGKSICPIDFEHMSIGPSEVSVSTFLYSYFSTVETIDIGILWESLRVNHVLDELNEPMLLSLLICRSCYEAIRRDIICPDENMQWQRLVNQLIEIWHSFNP